MVKSTEEKTINMKRIRFVLLVVILFIIPAIVIFTLYSISSSKKTNVILITIDTLRRDHLPCYGYRLNTAPNISSLARESIKFNDAISQSSWTLPALASIMTGMYPHRHRAVKPSTPIDKRMTMLAEYIKKSGYKTAGFVSHIFASEKYGFNKGFSTFDSSNAKDSEWRTTSENITNLGINWLKKTNKKFFLWLHYFDPHDEYIFYKSIDFKYTNTINENENLIFSGWNDYPNPYLEYCNKNKEKYISLYDGEIFNTDYYIGEFISFLKKHKYLRNTIIVLTSDHGESFNSYGLYGHDNFLYSDLINVPLIIYIPKVKHEVITNVCETKDIMPTILDLLDIEKPEYLNNNLLSEKRDLAFSDVENKNPNRKVAIINNSWKLIYTVKERLFELYDLKEDPGEMNNLAKSNPPVVDTLKKVLLDTMEIIELDEETFKRLKSLGYIR